MTSNTLRSKTALVTGSTSGIGQAIAQAFAEAGANVAVNGFGDPGPITTWCRHLADRCEVNVAFLPADVSDPEAVERMMGAASASLGPVDILVNSAGVNYLAEAEQLAPAEWDKVIAVHLSAAFHTSRLALPTMKTRNWGRIINVASVYGLVGGLQRAAYASAKHGLVGLTKVIALETTAFNITCNALCPGLVNTPPVENRIQEAMTSSHQTRDEVLRTMMAQRQPTGQLVEPSSLASLALFLCSDAARDIRGVALPVDGAWTAR